MDLVIPALISCGSEPQTTVGSNTGICLQQYDENGIGYSWEKASLEIEGFSGC